MTLLAGNLPLVETKLYRPVARPAAVARPRLVQRLRQGMSSRLTLVAAPAGSGKSTLLAQALHGVQMPVAWLSLDAADNDVVRFWTYVSMALERAAAGSGATALEALRSVPPAVEVARAALVNSLAAQANDVVLVLDDYHTIENTEIHEGMTALLEHAPPQLHVIIGSRSDPPLPLARWRVRGELLEVRAADLRFTADEALQFLNETMGLQLDEAEVAVLEKRTEGWIAGLQLAALSLQGATDTTAFVEAFGGSHRHVADYLVEEVINRQAAPVRAFLLQTSVLQRISAPLGAAVALETVGTEAEAEAILSELEQQNLFLIALDSERRWYRYHHLFADLLRQRLRQERAPEVPELRRRAAQWFESQGNFAEAISYALAADDTTLAARYLAENGKQLAATGETQMLRAWLEALPGAMLLGDARLCVVQAWVLMLERQLVAMEPYLDAAEAALDAEAPNVSLRGELLALRAHVKLEQGAFMEARALAERALEMLPDAEVWARSSSMLVLAYALYLTGRTAEAVAAYGESISLCRAAGNVVGVLFSAAEVVKLQVLQGRLGAARESAVRALRQAEEQGWAELAPVSALHIRLADVMIERWELAQAEAELARALALTQAGPAITAARAQIFLARLHQLRGNERGADEALTAVQAIVADWEPGGERAFFEAFSTRIRVMQGKLTAARQWAAQRKTWQEAERPSYFREIELLTMARVEVLDGRAAGGKKRLVKTARMLEQLWQVAGEQGRGLVVIEALALAALALAQAGYLDRALGRLDDALELAEGEGFVTLFVELGGPLRALLAANVARRGRDDALRRYELRLLQTLEACVSRPGAPAVTLEEDVGLTKREHEVLQLLASGLSGPDIAEHLVVSINTVKTQMKSIYSKLDAHSREEALHRARELGLVS